ncbi:MAG TPA: lysozyme inhibitor LprI family protein [Burkholderiales bacterium]|nr:lysozyme inhibitor LprI family protein [Burkholderiales bacterium]
MLVEIKSYEVVTHAKSLPTLQATLFVLFVAAPIASLAQRNAATEDACLRLPSHVEWRACFAAKFEQSNIELHDAEAAIEADIERWDFGPTYRARALAALREASASFARWRDAQCEFQATLAASGNGANDRRLLCAIELNQRRIADLKASGATRSR